MTTMVALVPSAGHEYPGHPEAPGRLSLLGDWEKKPFGSEVKLLEAAPAKIEEITAVHTERMVDALQAACRRGPGIIDYAPTYVTPSSFQDALNAAGATLACTRAVLEVAARNAFAIVRPPGHHAEPDQAMGFCLFNNLAVAAHAALAGGVGRILVVDFDAHHGNGTQAVFNTDERVAYFSTHQEGIYPGSGGIEDAPHARGRIVNLPLPPRAGDTAFAQIAAQVLVPLAERVAPELILVSAGFDAHWNDPITTLGLSSAGYYAFSQRLVELADRLCAGRIVFVLEGGYTPETVAAGVEAALSALTGKGRRPEAQAEGSGPAAGDRSPYPEPDVRSRIDHLLRWHEFT
jgi:acetoin utilization deacetylase AcuC-like enzyme